MNLTITPNFNNQSTNLKNKTNKSQSFGCEYCTKMVKLFKTRRPELNESSIITHVNFITSGEARGHSRSFFYSKHENSAVELYYRLINCLGGTGKPPKYFENHVKAIKKREV